MASASSDFLIDARNITLSDTVDLPESTIEELALLITVGTGAVKVRTAGGNDVTFNVPYAGWVTPFKVKRVFATGTTVVVGNIIALVLKD